MTRDDEPADVDTLVRRAEIAIRRGRGVLDSIQTGDTDHGSRLQNLIQNMRLP